MRPLTIALGTVLLAGCGYISFGPPPSAQSLLPSAASPEATTNRNSIVYIGPGAKNLTPAPRRTPSPAPTVALVPYTGPKTATVTLEDGRSFSFTLRGDAAPKTVANFVAKAQAKAYDGLDFHRVEDWVVQGGDPKGDGTGGGKMPAEYDALSFRTGSVGVARGPDRSVNNDMQFFVVLNDTSSFLDGNYTNFGQVAEGMDVVRSITVGTKIKTISVR